MGEVNKTKLVHDLNEGYNYYMEAGDSSDVMTVATEYYGYARALKGLAKSIEDGDYDE